MTQKHNSVRLWESSRAGSLNKHAVFWPWKSFECSTQALDRLLHCCHITTSPNSPHQHITDTNTPECATTWGVPPQCCTHSDAISAHANKLGVQCLTRELMHALHTQPGSESSAFLSGLGTGWKKKKKRKMSSHTVGSPHEIESHVACSRPDYPAGPSTRLGLRCGRSRARGKNTCCSVLSQRVACDF